MTDVDGRRIFDCANNFFSLIHGHAFPPVMSALERVLHHGTAFGLPTSAENDLAEEIKLRSAELEQIRFTGSGTEAVMFAVKAARAITNRPAIAKFEGAYHGAYDYVEVSLDPPLDQGDAEHPRSYPYAKGTPASVAEEVVVLPFDNAAVCRELLTEHKDRLAAVVLDPLSSRISMVPVATDVREAVQERCRRYGILLVLDEVVSYRLGHGGAYRLYGLQPDLVALAKIIGGGLPVGAVAGPARHMSVFDHASGKPAVSHGGTFSANPLSMTAGLASLRAFDAEAVSRLNDLGRLLREMLAERIASGGLSAQITGEGSFFRLHLKRGRLTNYRSAYPSPSQKEALRALHLAVLQRGYLLAPNCSGALSTPMTSSDMHDLASAIVESLREIRQRSPWN